MRRDLPWLDDRMSKKVTRTVEIRSLDAKDVPERPGVYIMQAEDREYSYPWGESQVFYIGKSRKLRNRLWKTHRNFILQIMENRSDLSYAYYWPVYEYAGYHGCKVCWLACNDSEDAKKLENNMLVHFASHYGARPVANNQGAWRLE